MLHTLHTQLHFVRAIQAVGNENNNNDNDNTAQHIPPLRAIRDETAEGRAEATVTLETVRETLEAEECVGFRRRPRLLRTRRNTVECGGEDARSEEEELVERATAARRERGYYVVESGRAKGGE